MSLGKAHIRKSTSGHEEALRIFDMCPNLNNHDVLRDILKTSHYHSLDKYTEFENEEEFTDYMEAPNILCESKASLREKNYPTVGSVESL